MEHTACYQLFARTFPFWAGLPEEEKRFLCQHTATATYQKGQNIHGGSGECTGCIVVKSGCVRAYLLSEEGREVTLYRLYPGDLCMLSASCVLQAITFDVLIDAEEESCCHIIAGGAFAQLAARQLEVENFALGVAVSRFSDVMWVMQQILFMSYDKRLAIFLWDEMVKTGSTHLPLTQGQVAKYTGSAREVVSRMLKYFASEGIVIHGRGGIDITDREKLRSLTV